MIIDTEKQPAQNKIDTAELRHKLEQQLDVVKAALALSVAKRGYVGLTALRDDIESLLLINSSLSRAGAEVLQTAILKKLDTAAGACSLLEGYNRTFYGLAGTQSKRWELKDFHSPNFGDPIVRAGYAVLEELQEVLKTGSTPAR